jgi:nucleoside-diphosphate-sugar epimerase
MRALIIGCGYVGSALAMELARRGHTVEAVRRTEVRNEQLEAAGVRVLTADITNPRDLPRLETSYDWVVNCVAPSSGGPAAYSSVYLEGNQNLVSHFKGSGIRKFVYTSSSGVYGQDDGSEVFEDCPAVPESDTGRILRQAEIALLDAHANLKFPGIILRVSGIYGPGRSYWLRMFLAGEADFHPDSRYMNMIHRDDVVGAIIIALEKGKAGEIYNASDNEPVRQSDLFAWLADRTGRPAPQPGSGPGGEPRRRTVTNKRISNRKLREELGWQPGYPTFREGYSALLET